MLRNTTCYNVPHMAHILPFRALRYDPQRVPVASVVTQPYDKITPKMQEGYYSASPFNLVRIILGKPEPSDSAHNSNVYSRAAGYLADWRRQGIFAQDPQPSLYVYAQRFVKPGTHAELERRGFIALGRVEDYSTGVVYRHEQTLSKPKADRLDLLRSTRAHFGQIFMLYSDTGEIDNLLTQDSPPTTEVTDEYGVAHRLWRVSDPALIDLVRGKMRDKKLVIADGHHRYETALNYRNERRASGTGPAGSSVPGPGGNARSTEGQESPYEFAMMTFINMNSPGLLILPTHRVVHGLANFSPEQFQSSARAYFQLEDVDPAVDASRASAILRDAGQKGTALLAATATRVFLLHSPTAPASLFPGLSARQQSLDVVQLHKVLLEHVLGFSEESIRNQQNLSYVREADEALATVRSGKANVAFLMNPCRMEQVRDIALAGEVLPQKSTDFYPKLLSGLTVYALE